MSTALMKQQMKAPPERFYVYIHKKASNGHVFYVGKGKDSRAWSSSGRSNHWRNIVNKHGYEVEIVKDGISEQDAWALEILLISEMRESGFGLCNISDGGEGPSGTRHTEETKEKFRKAKLGKKQMPDHAQKSRTARLGQKNKPSAIEKTAASRRRKIISSKGVCYQGVEMAVKHLREVGINAHQGIISLCASGKRNNAYGITWSYDTSETPKFRPTRYQSKKVECVGLAAVFFSASDAARWVREWRGKSNTQSITKAAREGGTAYGYSWRYTDEV